MVKTPSKTVTKQSEMADKPPSKQPTINKFEVQELKLGASFTNPNPSTQFHTVKYDFKPASVDENKMASLDVATNNEVTITLPHLDGAGVPQTVFKGNQRPYAKECVLIIDHATGEVTLEKLSSNIQVKKTRQKGVQPPPISPVTYMTNTTQRSSSRTPVPSGKRTNRNSKVRYTKPKSPSALFYEPTPGAADNVAGPSNLVHALPKLTISMPQTVTWHHPSPWTGGGDSTDPSMPMIEPEVALSPAVTPTLPQTPPEPHNLQQAHVQASLSPTSTYQPPPPSPVNPDEVLDALLNDIVFLPLPAGENGQLAGNVSDENDADGSDTDWCNALLFLNSDDLNGERGLSEPGNISG